MPGDRNKPVDGTIIVQIGELQAEGRLAGLTIAEAKTFIIERLPDPSAMPADAVARITTMDPAAEAWQNVASPEEGSLVMLSTDWGIQMLQGVSKTVPDEYVIRPQDVHLSFTAPAEKTPP